MKRSLIIALGIATLVKLVLAAVTIGTNDVATWRAFAHNAVLCGRCAYQFAGPYGDPFNHPPFIIHFLKLIGMSSAAWFPFWIRVPAILADIGMVLVATRLMPGLSTRLSVLLALNPVSILVSGFHGNTDPVMIFFLVLAIYLLKTDRFNWAAAAFGMAINIKIVPLLMVPAILIYIWSRRSAKSMVLFVCIAAVVVLALSMPYILSNPLAILKATLGYRGLYGRWGISLVLVGFPISEVGHEVAYRVLQLLVIALTLVLAVYLNRRKIDLIYQMGLIFFLFFLLTPAHALQYLTWPVPFILALGFWWSLAYYTSAGLYLFLTYNFWSQGKWYFADSHITLELGTPSFMAGFVCWGVCAMICLRYKHILTKASGPQKGT
jgi:ALG3 protein